MIFEPLLYLDGSTCRGRDAGATTIWHVAQSAGNMNGFVAELVCPRSPQGFADHVDLRLSASSFERI